MNNHAFSGKKDPIVKINSKIRLEWKQPGSLRRVNGRGHHPSPKSSVSWWRNGRALDPRSCCSSLLPAWKTKTNPTIHWLEEMGKIEGRTTLVLNLTAPCHFADDSSFAFSFRCDRSSINLGWGRNLLASLVRCRQHILSRYHLLLGLLTLISLSVSE